MNARYFLALYAGGALGLAAGLHTIARCAALLAALALKAAP